MELPYLQLSKDWVVNRSPLQERQGLVKYLILLLVVIGGSAIPVQVAANKRMEQAVRSPALAATIAFIVGAIVLALVTATGWLGRGQLADAARAPWWAWAGGALSLFTVVSIIALPQVGAAVVIAATVFGQLTAAAVLDHFGWFGVPQIRMNWWRVCGAIALFAGAVMIH